MNDDAIIYPAGSNAGAGSGAGGTPSGGARRRQGGGAWRSLLLTGVLVIAAGVGLVIWPFFAATWLLAVFIGAALIANGLAVIARGGGASPAVFGGLILIAAGVLAVAFPELTATAVITFAGIGFIGIGVLWIGVAAAFPGGRRAAVLIPGILLLVGGVLALAQPAIALGIVAVVGGIVTLAIGGLIIWTALRIKRIIAGPDAASQTTIIVE